MLSNMFGERANVGVRAARAVAALGTAYDELLAINEAIEGGNAGHLIQAQAASRHAARALQHGGMLMALLMKEQISEIEEDIGKMLEEHPNVMDSDPLSD